MCGIVGIVTNKPQWKKTAKERLFQEMLCADTFRGDHSTGYFEAQDSGKVWYRKEALNGWEFVKEHEALLCLDRNTRVLVGHNRYATMGALNAENAHPFFHGPITGVHNGSIHNWEDIFPKSNTFDVDSDALYGYLNDNSLDELLDLGIDGAFTLVWYDSSDKKLRIIRNEQRPLAYFHSKDNDLIGLASELDMLKWITNRSTYNGLNVGRKKFKELPPNTLMTIDPDTLEFTFEEKEVAKPKYVYPVNKMGGYTGGYYNGSTPWWERDYYGEENYTERNSDIPKPIYGREAAKEFGINYHDQLTFMITDEDWIPGVNGGHYGNIETVANNGHIIKVPNISKKEFDQVNNRKFTTNVDAMKVVHHRQWTGKDHEIIQELVQTVYHYHLMRLIKDGDAELLEPRSKDNPTTLKQVGLRQYVGPRGKIESEKEYHARFNKGCSACGSRIDPDKHSTYGWIKEESMDGEEREYPLCLHCVPVFPDAEYCKPVIVSENKELS